MYVVVGANGYLGSYMIKNILAYTNDTIIAIARNIPSSHHARIKWVSCDVAKSEEVEALNKDYLSSGEKSKVIYLAAYHHPDLVEKNPRIAWDTNITALSRFLNTIDNVECFYYPSSDSVYGESVNGYRFVEKDVLRPVNRYGKQKCVAEDLVIAYGYNVVRFPFLIAPSLLPTKKHFYDTIVETLKQGKCMEMFQDSYRSALNFDTAAELTVRMMESYRTAYPQILNVCGDDALSKYDIGLMIADKIGVSRDLIVPISVESNSGIFDARRASSTLMDNALLKKTFNLKEIKLAL